MKNAEVDGMLYQAQSRDRVVRTCTLTCQRASGLTWSSGLGCSRAHLVTVCVCYVDLVELAYRKHREGRTCAKLANPVDDMRPDTAHTASPYFSLTINACCTCLHALSEKITLGQTSLDCINEVEDAKREFAPLHFLSYPHVESTWHFCVMDPCGSRPAANHIVE